MHKNTIHLLEDGDREVTDHDGKAAVLLSYYSNLLGSASQPSWNFNLSELYADQNAWDPSALSLPFSASEIRSAFHGMNANSSPGPDGFGPSFFATYWNLVLPDVHDLFSSFFSHDLSLDGLNRAFLVLLPKKDGACSAANFRPLSLQTTIVKSLAKVLTNRLQPSIPLLVGPDQTGFIKGRCISENFVYAAELLSCCHRRKSPTIVLKLDFHKAFDSICWESLDRILRVRGFDDQWCL